MDFAPAKPPVDLERQRAELALMAAAPLQGNRKGKPRQQHDASDLDLFKAANEPGLFADPPPPPAPTTRAAELAVWERESARIDGIVEAEIAAGRVHWLKWGEGRFGKAPYWTLQLVERAGEVICREEMELHNSGSFGCWRSHGKTTIEAVKLERCKARVNDAACDIAVDHEDKRVKQQRTLASWISEQFPPLLCGHDFAQQLERDLATFTARNKLRCAAICAGEREYVDERGRTLIITSLGRNDHD